MKNIVVVVLTILLFFPGMGYALDNVEKQKIDFLISSVEHLKGLKFIRNGSEYDAKDAADHLKMKLEKAGSRVQTADDFIRLCGSRSYITGKPYLIKFPDGKVLKSETYLRDKLKEYSKTVK